MKRKKDTAIYYLYGKHAVDSAINNPVREIFELLLTKNNLRNLNKYKVL